MQYKISNTCVHNINYHLVWCPKYRKPVLVNGVETRLEELIHNIASDLKINIIALEIMPDHVHLFVNSGPQYPPHKLVKAFKGSTSGILRTEFPELRKIPTLWTRSYYCGTAGYVSSSTIKLYVENQKRK